jgi:nickel/cobalt transporter (NicO) family protein
MTERSFPAGARRARSRGGARRRLLAIAGATVVGLLVPAAAAAHPLGNFTINHFAAVRVGSTAVALDVVIDRAEIPAFQEVQRLDADKDGALGPAEVAGARVAECQALATELNLAVDGQVLHPALVAAGLSLPPGAGGLATMRLVCEYEAAFAAPLSGPARVTFEDRSFAERIGWREIVIVGDGVSIDAGAAAAGAAVADAAAADAEGVSRRLTNYPTDLLALPLDVRSLSAEVTAGGPALTPWVAPDAEAIGADGPAPAMSTGGASASVPGGVGEDLARLVDVTDLTPLAVLVSLAVAFGLGIVHALSPGHGKTIMAAYLVGGRGSSRQAVGLGLAVTISHTVGVLALALITLAASSALPPERLYPVLGVASGALVIVIGASLLWSRLRATLVQRARQRAHAAAHEHGDAHDHGHDQAHDHGHDHGAPGDTISWRGLIALGLSGGLVPSASALILLLGSIAAGRVAYGVVLVLGFGLGMAVVLTGIGLLLVHARRLVERRRPVDALYRLALPVQVATASIVVVLGVVLTGQALSQVL